MRRKRHENVMSIVMGGPQILFNNFYTGYPLVINKGSPDYLYA